MTLTALFDDDDFDEFVILARAQDTDRVRRRWAHTRKNEPQAEALCAEFERRLDMAKRGYPPKIFSLPDSEGWYSGPIDSDRYWPAVRDYLDAHTPMSDDQIGKLDQASTKIVAHTADPKRPTWDTRGLVVGYVQSGKTTNFTAVIAKAIDVGYNFVVVLSGIHNGLRKQTQERLQLQLCSKDPGGLVRMTTIDRDFLKPPQTLESVLPGPGERKAILCVVKKNTAPLKKLKNWLLQAKQSGGLSRVKALIIDDEADQASVATARINPLIRDILRELPKRTFIGYTATPFANVLIGTVDSDDLYPKDFILNLPEPEGYFGPRMIFGRDELPRRPGDVPVDGYDLVREVPLTDAAALRPPKNIADYHPVLPDTLVRALLWFWIATATRRARGDVGHSSMLVHTTMRTKAHDALRHPIEELCRDVHRRVVAGKFTVETVRENGDKVSWDLESLWADETSCLPADTFKLPTIDFASVARHLPDVVEDTKVVLEHSKSLERLSYEDEPVTAIAIGGNTLSRGLTLEGLVVSYFIRSANAYDTLMQMGRWFGFRNGYQDLPRIYMTAELRKWFRHLTAVEEEMRLEIRSYEEQSMRPTDFGVRIRTHPQLLVTQKLGASRTASTSYGGRRIQVRYFKHRNEQWLKHNTIAASALVLAADNNGTLEQVAPDITLWRDVPVSAVRDFLGEYEVHEDSPDMNRQLILDYIEKEIGAGSLHTWSVAVVAGEPGADTTEVKLGGRQFKSVVRSRLKDGEKERADIKTLMSKEHRVLDLGIPLAQARRDSEENLMNARQRDDIHKSRGLLVLYPIDRASPPADEDTTTREALNAVEDVIGLALVFPGNKTEAIKNSYISADVAQKPVEPEEAVDLDELIDVDTESDDAAAAATE